MRVSFFSTQSIPNISHRNTHLANYTRINFVCMWHCLFIFVRLYHSWTVFKKFGSAP